MSVDLINGGKMNFYIADTHFGHNNIIQLDNRPFLDMIEMEGEMVRRWNDVVGKKDDVYILGDFCWSTKPDDWNDICDKLNGNKHLILGNHDIKKMPVKAESNFVEITSYKEINDCKRMIMMSHYPMPFYNHDHYPNAVMLYGHVHVTLEQKMMDEITDYIKENYPNNYCKTINVGCMMPWMDYTPRTISELLINRKMV
jgi:calcineurin-like phosphoesterase family protein